MTTPTAIARASHAPSLPWVAPEPRRLRRKEERTSTGGVGSGRFSGESGLHLARARAIVASASATWRARMASSSVACVPSSACCVVVEVMTRRREILARGLELLTGALPRGGGRLAILEQLVALGEQRVPLAREAITLRDAQSRSRDDAIPRGREASCSASSASSFLTAASPSGDGRGSLDPGLLGHGQLRLQPGDALELLPAPASAARRARGAMPRTRRPWAL